VIGDKMMENNKQGTSGKQKRDVTIQKEKRTVTDNSANNEKYVYFVVAKKWRKVSPGIFIK